MQITSGRMQCITGRRDAWHGTGQTQYQKQAHERDNGGFHLRKEYLSTYLLHISPIYVATCPFQSASLHLTRSAHFVPCWELNTRRA